MGTVISGLLGGNEAPPPAPAPVIVKQPAPTIDDTAMAKEQAANDLRRKRGSAANILAGADQSTATTGGASVGTKALLGN